MKNTFAVTMTLLLALTLGGSLAGYRMATAEREEPAKSGEAATAGESSPSPSASTTGSAGPSTAQGDTAASQGGTQAGENGAVIAAGGEQGSTGSTAEPQADGAAMPADSSATAAGDAKAGATVFASNCAGCHGAAAKGGVGANLTTADGPKAWTDAQMITALREGKTPQKTLNTIMPRFTAAQVSDTDIANIHAWIKSLN
ncbi:c-type cytochrome [Deinococcus sp. KSM4-11]|uniref:c-type cytochrome n=1 Tax=Deinococcus sp. KSM4-11 TaxID=2568654 RepID=UPI001F0F9441|nr:c-type cytochrome [Deinococcus sp. KSM4-11]